MPIRSRRSRPKRRAAGPVVAAVLLLAGAGRLAAQTLPVPVVVVYPGDIIRDGMLADREMPADYAGGAFAVMDRSSLVGKTARRTLLPGQPISSNAVAEPKVVSLGAMVRVVYKEGGLSIMTYALALQAGGVGDVIPVRNTESGITVSGTVQIDGTVRVGNG